MTSEPKTTLNVINRCVHHQPYPTFDETGKESLPCGDVCCHTTEGKAFHPRRRTCAQCGNPLHSACPVVFFCCEDCLIASQTEREWKESIPPGSVESAQLASEEEKAKRKNTRNKYLNSPKGRRTKREQNRRNYAKRKANGKAQAYYRGRVARKNGTIPKPEEGESSEGGLRAK